MSLVHKIKLEDIPEDQIIFYDLETTSQFAPYCELKMIGAKIGFKGEAFLVETFSERKRFRERMASRDVIKVAFNNRNFDDLVLWRHGIPVEEENLNDLFLMAKTVGPRIPAYSLKFLNWYYFGEMHLPEMLLHDWMKHTRTDDMWKAPKELLGPYCLHDVYPQTQNLFELFWPIVQRDQHWEAYTEVELPMGLVMEEIMLRGGEYLDAKLIETKIATLQNEKEWWEDDVYKRTGGRVSNPNSVKQVGEYLRDEDEIELELTDKGNFSLKKADVLDFLDLDNSDRDRSKIIRGLFEVRRINNTLSYYRNYLEALGASRDVKRKTGWIPKQYSLSGARTRRILSNSRFKLNFQNPNEAAKEVQVVPPGWLGWWIDATQVENVVHIYESGDADRRAAYEADKDWNEYVWLCNVSLGNSLGKKELDAIPSPINPQWSVYKQFKHTKLGVNFGMGIAKFARMSKLADRAAQAAFAALHRASPAIRNLQKRIAQDLTQKGFVQDVFGHTYSGAVNIAYKVVAYLIQGCGTGSLPKVQMRANYETVHQWDRTILPHERKTKWLDTVVVDHPRDKMSFGVMAGTTHDENSGRLSLNLNPEQIIATLQQLMFNMTERFSHKFDGIPLRAKLYLSRTTTADRVEIKDAADVVELFKVIYGREPTKRERASLPVRKDRVENNSSLRPESGGSDEADAGRKPRWTRTKGKKALPLVVARGAKH